jgi:predicted enzyme related to lactoylglutathione lyase
MFAPNYVLLYVDQPSASAAFYADLLGLAPVESSATFALFVLPSGLKLGFWSKHTVEPAFSGAGATSELCMSLGDLAALEQTYEQWQDKGLSILQPLTVLDFGTTFVALDPDGHRLRVFVPSE